MHLPGNQGKNQIGFHLIFFEVDDMGAGALAYQEKDVKIMFVGLLDKKVLLEMIRKGTDVKISFFPGLGFEVLNLVNGQVFLRHGCFV